MPLPDCDWPMEAGIHDFMAELARMAEVKKGLCMVSLKGDRATVDYFVAEFKRMSGDKLVIRTVSPVWLDGSGLWDDGSLIFGDREEDHRNVASYLFFSLKKPK